MTKSKKNPLWGCLFYVTLVSPAFFLTRWEVAASIAVLITVLMIMYGGIVHEIKKMRKLRDTPRSVISNTPGFGYVKLVAKVKPPDLEVVTLFSSRPAAYRWISFQHAYTNEKRDADGSTRYESGWSSFYDDETDLKALQIYDATGSCYLGLHHAHYYINYQEKEFTAFELLQFIKEKNLIGIPIDKITEDQKLKVVERWIEKDQPITFYGTMNKLSLDHVPHDIIKAADKALKYGADDDTRKRDPERKLDEADWKDLIIKAKADGARTLDILTADYTNTAENELVLNANDNKALNSNSYIAIVVYLIGAVVLSLVWYGFVNTQYPEFFEQFR